MSVPIRFYLLALKVAEKSNHPKYKMGAVVFSGGRVLATAANSGRLREHAEERVLKKAAHTEGATIVVARLRGRNSTPCLFCSRLIKEAGIKRVIFVDFHGSLVELKTEELSKKPLKDYCLPRMNILNG